MAVCKAEKQDAVKKAGAQEAGGEELLAKIQGGWLDFDLLIATPDMMSKVGKLGKLLGSRGLMPNPKIGTVTPDIVQAVKEFSSGKCEYRNDKYGNVHFVIGKKSFDSDKLVSNFNVLHDALLKAKSSKVKGRYIESVYLCSTMSQSVLLDLVD